MSKSLVVINTPENCYCCAFSQEINGFDYCCGCNDMWYENQLEDEEMETRPKWCPLQPLPTEREIDTSDDYTNTVNTGYNECLDEIVGG